MTGEDSVSVPNVFYDLIVFVSPSVLLVVGLIIGFNGWPITYIIEKKFNIGAINFLFVLLFFIFIGYEYGRLIETLSSPFVSKPLKFLHRHRILLKDPDFKMDLSREVESLSLGPLEGCSKSGGKWAIYFHATLVCPHIGLDLLKRYAWEKLSRSSALTFLILVFLSLLFHFYEPHGVKQLIPSKWLISSWIYTAVMATLCIAAYFEHYQRNSWNNDLLAKIIPVLILAEKIKFAENTSSIGNQNR